MGRCRGATAANGETGRRVIIGWRQWLIAAMLLIWYFLQLNTFVPR
jgi:hypothetical protein